MALTACRGIKIRPKNRDESHGLRVSTKSTPKSKSGFRLVQTEE